MPKTKPKRQQRPPVPSTCDLAAARLTALERIGKVRIGIARAQSELRAARSLITSGDCGQAQAALDSAEERLRNAHGLAGAVSRRPGW